MLLWGSPGQLLFEIRRALAERRARAADDALAEGIIHPDVEPGVTLREQTAWVIVRARRHRHHRRRHRRVAHLGVG